MSLIMQIMVGAVAFVIMVSIYFIITRDESLIEKNSVKQILKLICSCIYKKVDENDADGKEKAYKSFQILAKYLEGKGITGIIYPCTRTNRIKGKNVVLFNIHDAVPIIGSITQYHYNGAV